MPPELEPVLPELEPPAPELDPEPELVVPPDPEPPELDPPVLGFPESWSPETGAPTWVVAPLQATTMSDAAVMAALPSCN